MHSQDSDYQVGGKRGFETNMDDFLLRFGSYVENAGDKETIRLAKSRTSPKGPLLEDVSLTHAESEQLDYTLREQTFTNNKNKEMHKTLKPDKSDFDLVQVVADDVDDDRKQSSFDLRKARSDQNNNNSEMDYNSSVNSELRPSPFLITSPDQNDNNLRDNSSLLSADLDKIDE